uniref:Mitochondrial division protein 1 n=1 Tax=Podospora anserina TaxID=2587412 RepID=Q8X1P2_PODAS|nr:beta transducin-like protein HET-D2Y [Podospora anserina]
MRLLERNDTGDFSLTDDIPDDQVPPYAILSHTWGDEEIIFKDIKDGICKKKRGYSKIQFCGDQAGRDGLKFFWVDTCCIDKSDSTEVQRALNSMFQWYRNAAKCYVYLTDVSTCQHYTDGNSGWWELTFRKSRWFTRGWTLQEAHSPVIVEFFSKEGERLGDKKSLEQQIHDITEIPLEALPGNTLSDFSIEERLSWVGKRNTTQKEDKAYSLFGIFDITMPLLYGEGEDRAFGRLREEISKHDRCLSSLHSSSPRLDKKRIEEAKGGLLTGAYRWVFANPDFCLWRERSESRLLWINGDPGKGKTMLLCGIINELQGAIVEDGHCRNLAYFFCQATDSRINNAIAVLRGLIYLLAHQQPRLISHVRKYTDAGKSLSDANAWFALSDILVGMLGDPNVKPTCLVVDALDECVIDLPKLLDFIVCISSDRIKWLLTSRNETIIEKKLKSNNARTRLSLELKENAMEVSHAVDVYIDDKLSGLEALQDDALLKDQVRDILHNKANDTFLWVALVVQELSMDGVESWHVLQIVEEVPPGLDGMYKRMLDEIERNKRDSEFCWRILSVVTVAYRPLYLDEIGGLSGLPEQIVRSTENIQKIVAKCGSFLTVRDNQIYLVHQSAKDYLSDQASPLLFPSGVAVTHHDISDRSLKLLSGKLQRDRYGLCIPGFSIDHVRVPDPDPLATVRYSCVYWVDHLCNWQSSDDSKHPNIFQDGGIVDSFLRQHYLHWLEALSLCKSMPQGILSLAKLESILQHKSITSQLLSLVTDMHRFVIYWRWVVENYPLQVYASALVFSPARSITRGLFTQEERKWITSRPIVEDNWNACRQTLEGHSGSVNSVTFSPDSKWVASGLDDSTIKIWEAATGSCTQTLEGHGGWVLSVAFSPDSKWVASGSADSTIKIWEAATGSCTQTLEGHGGWVYSVAFSPDSKWVVSGSADSTIKIWEAATGSCTQTLEGHGGWVWSVAFSPDSKWVASGSADSTIKIWEAATGSCTQTLEGHGGPVNSVAFSPDSKWVASGSDDHTIKIWEAATGSCTQTLEGHGGPVNSVTFSPDSKWVASGSDDHTIKIWEAATGSCTQTLEGHGGWVYSVAFSPDSKWVVSGSADSTIKIWEAATGSCTQTLEGHGGSVNSVAFSPDSKWVASGSTDRTIKIWEAATGSCTQTLEGHGGWAWSVAFSPDSKWVASGSADSTIKIWEAATGSCTQTLEGHGGPVNSVAFSPDSKWVASGSDDHTIKIWEAATGSCTQTLEGHGRSVKSVAFSPDSKWVASGSTDRTIKIWEAATGSCTQTLEGHGGSVKSVASSLDSKLIASGSNDTNPPHYQRYGIDMSKRWITKGSENWLWLPLEYQSQCFAAAASTIAICCSSGRVLTMKFTTDS